MSSPIIDATNPSELAGYVDPRLTEIRNGVLMTDVDGNGKSLGVLSSLEIGYKDTKEICIGTRTVGYGHSEPPAGKGSWDDPFDSSTVLKHDTIWRTKVAAGAIVRYRDDVHRTTGMFGHNTAGFRIPAGVTVLGEGIGKTIIQCVYYPPAAGANGHAIFSGSSDTDGNGNVVDGFTFDCNWQNLGVGAATKMAAVSLYGNHCKIQNCEHINSYGNLANLAENFAFLITVYEAAGVPQDCVGALIADCIGRAFQGDYGVAMAIFGATDLNPPNIASKLNGTIKGNKVYNWNGTCAYQALGDGFAIVDNQMWGGKMGIHIDTGQFDNVTIARNMFRGITIRGVDIIPALGTASCRNLVVADNRIELAFTEATSPVGISLNRDNDKERPSNAKFTGNTITAIGTPTLGGNGIAAQNTDGLAIANNTISSLLTNTVNSMNCTAVTMRDNLNELGNVALGLSGVGALAAETSEETPVGSLEIGATITVADGHYIVTLAPSSAYVIATGDKFVFDQMAPSTNPDCRPAVALQFTDMVTTVYAADQNGLVPNDYPVRAEISSRIRGRFYKRQVALNQITAYAADGFTGKTVSQAVIEIRSNFTGLHRYFYRNIVIVDANGVEKCRFFQDYDAAPTVGLATTPVNVSGAYVRIVPLAGDDLTP